MLPLDLLVVHGTPFQQELHKILCLLDRTVYCSVGILVLGVLPGLPFFHHSLISPSIISCVFHTGCCERIHIHAIFRYLMIQELYPKPSSYLGGGVVVADRESAKLGHSKSDISVHFGQSIENVSHQLQNRNPSTTQEIFQIGDESS